MNSKPMLNNIDQEVVVGFGDEWKRFDQTKLSKMELEERFNEYFNLFPWNSLPKDAVGFDLGCGSGRWAKLVSPKVNKLYCFDPSFEALEIAKINLSSEKNCILMVAGADTMPIPDDSMDFGYSLGVLHHVPNTFSALESCVKKLRSGAPFLLYLYYAFDNRPFWFKFIWKFSEIGRLTVSRMPHFFRYLISQIIALFIYWPFTRVSLLLEKLGFDISNFPLSYYRQYSFYTMRTDALDRFGTRLEKRFTRDQISSMMQEAGLEKISFSSSAPYWCAMGYKS